jgi:hypothetical protein
MTCRASIRGFWRRPRSACWRLVPDRRWLQWRHALRHVSASGSVNAGDGRRRGCRDYTRVAGRPEKVSWGIQRCSGGRAPLRARRTDSSPRRPNSDTTGTDRVDRRRACRQLIADNERGQPAAKVDSSRVCPLAHCNRCDQATKAGALCATAASPRKRFRGSNRSILPSIYIACPHRT